jgi:hypothetical protein
MTYVQPTSDEGDEILVEVVEGRRWTRQRQGDPELIPVSELVRRHTPEPKKARKRLRPIWVVDVPQLATAPTDRGPGSPTAA